MSTKWQRWVRQLRFSNGSLWYSSSPFSCLAKLGLHLFVPYPLTPGQEVFGSFVVAYLECYRESSSDGRPALLLSAVNPWKEKKGGENENRWLVTVNNNKNRKIQKLQQFHSSARGKVDCSGRSNALENPPLMVD